MLRDSDSKKRQYATTRASTTKTTDGTPRNESFHAEGGPIAQSRHRTEGLSPGTSIARDESKRLPLVPL